MYHRLILTLSTFFGECSTVKVIPHLTLSATRWDHVFGHTQTNTPSCALKKLIPVLSLKRAVHFSPCKIILFAKNTNVVRTTRIGSREDPCKLSRTPFQPKSCFSNWQIVLKEIYNPGPVSAVLRLIVVEAWMLPPTATRLKVKICKRYWRNSLISTTGALVVITV